MVPVGNARFDLAAFHQCFLGQEHIDLVTAIRTGKPVNEKSLRADEAKKLLEELMA